MILVHVAEGDIRRRGLLITGRVTAGHSFGGLGWALCRRDAGNRHFCPAFAGEWPRCRSQFQSQWQLPSILCYH